MMLPGALAILGQPGAVATFIWQGYLHHTKRQQFFMTIGEWRSLTPFRFASFNLRLGIGQSFLCILITNNAMTTRSGTS
jgi:hypothetical protein